MQSINQHFPVNKPRSTTTNNNNKRKSSIITNINSSITGPELPINPITGKPLRKLVVGNTEREFGKDLLELPDSTELYHNGQYKELRQRLEDEGVILVRNVINIDTVTGARSSLLTHIASKGAIAANTVPIDGYISKTINGRLTKGWTVDAGTGGSVDNREPDSAVDGWYSVGTAKSVTDVYNGPDLHTFYSAVFSGDNNNNNTANTANNKPFTTFPDCTWIRIRGQGDVTAEHTDYYYFKKATNIFSDHWEHQSDPTVVIDSHCNKCRKANNDDSDTILCSLCDSPYHLNCLDQPLPNNEIPEFDWHCNNCANKPFPYWTCWIALGRVTSSDGRLALIPRSHKLYSGYHNSSNELLPSSFTPSIERNSIWYSSDLNPGDLILFNIKTVHAASKNISGKYRLSCDTRVTTAKGNGINRRLAEEAAEAEINGSDGGTNCKKSIQSMTGMMGSSSSNDSNKKQRRSMTSMTSMS